jgi:hypothetical protein
MRRGEGAGVNAGSGGASPYRQTSLIAKFPRW